MASDKWFPKHEYSFQWSGAPPLDSELRITIEDFFGPFVAVVSSPRQGDWLVEVAGVGLDPFKRLRGELGIHAELDYTPDPTRRFLILTDKLGARVQVLHGDPFLIAVAGGLAEYLCNLWGYGKELTHESGKVISDR